MFRLFCNRLIIESRNKNIQIYRLAVVSVTGIIIITQNEQNENYLIIAKQRKTQRCLVHLKTYA